MISRQLLGLAAALAACGRTKATKETKATHDSCDAETRKDALVVGLHKHGAANVLDFALTSLTPMPPARGDNTWLVQLTTISSGAPVGDATVTMTPFMPDHGHGTPIKVNATATPTAGQYQLSPINVWMPGYWEATIQATQGATSDSVVFKFCIPN